MMFGRDTETARKLQKVEFVDHDGNACELKQSSLGQKSGSEYVLIGNVSRSDTPFMHLSRDQVVGLIGRLQRWIDTGGFVQ